MDEELIRQVQILADIVRAQSERLDQVFKAMDELAKDLRETSLAIKEAIAETVTGNEAVQASVSDLDAIADDLAKVTSALLLLEEEEEEEQHGQTGG